jgi:DNA invertase Pin-like site-specific DNA recombinase
MRKAYSYLRYSTPEQSKGDSIRRQLELSQRYAKEHGLDLDESLKPDRGVSAFRGKNKTEGNLGSFLEDVKAGRVPKGSVLLVESLDRLSREDIETALDGLRAIVNAGVEVHTLSDGQIYRKGEMRLQEYIISIVTMARANEESQRKSQRVGAAWRQKKSEANGSRAITSKVPMWLSAKKGEPIQVIPDRAKIVKEIFRMAASGIGKRVIARRLNEGGTPTWGRSNGWQDSYVEKILHNRAVLGEYQPHRRTPEGRVPDGEPIVGYFPAVITPAEWDAVHTAPRLKTGRVGRTIRNLFTGLVFDANLQRNMSYEDKGSGWRYLVTDSRRFGIDPHRIPYAEFEKGFLRFLDQLDWTTVLNVSDSTDLKAAEELVANVRAEIQAAETKLEKVADLLIDTPSETLKKRVIELEAKLESDRERLAQARVKLEEIRNHNRDMLDHSVVYSSLLNATDLETRAKLRQEIARKVKRIECHFDAAGKKGAILCVVRFANGAKRGIVIRDWHFTVLEPDESESEVEQARVTSAPPKQAGKRKIVPFTKAA